MMMMMMFSNTFIKPFLLGNGPGGFHRQNQHQALNCGEEVKHFKALVQTLERVSLILFNSHLPLFLCLSISHPFQTFWSDLVSSLLLALIIKSGLYDFFTVVSSLIPTRGGFFFNEKEKKKARKGKPWKDLDKVENKGDDDLFKFSVIWLIWIM